MQSTTCLVVIVSSATKILVVKGGTSFDLATCRVSLPAFFVPATSALVLLKWIFSNQYALSNLLILDIYVMYKPWPDFTQQK
jgi:hypothetical protein